MFNLGFGEILVICVVLIIVVGPERLPAVMKNVGKTLRTVRQASREIQNTVGLDELWREDVLNTPPPRPRMPPPATLSRETAPAPTASTSEAVASTTGAVASTTGAVATPSVESAPAAETASPPTPPASDVGGGKGEG